MSERVTWILNEYLILDCQSLEMSHYTDSVLMGCYQAVGSVRKITQVFTHTVVMNAEIDTFLKHFLSGLNLHKYVLYV